MIEVSVSSAAVDESNSNYLRFTVTLSQPAIELVTLDYRTLLNGTADDSDLYGAASSNANNGSLTFAPGVTSQDILIRAGSDSLDEADEAITLELGNLSANAMFEGGHNVLRTFGIIRDDDGSGSNLAIFVSDPVITEGDSGNRAAVFEIHLSRPATTDFSVDYRTVGGSAISGQDFAPVNGQAEFRIGQSVATVSVPITTDTVAETSETLSLIVTPPATPAMDVTGAVGNATILDDDSGPGAVVSMSTEPVIEGYYNYLRVTVTLSEPPIDSVSMHYRTLLDQTATDSDLYNAASSSSNNGTLSFAPGQTSTSFFVRMNSDSEDERDEAFTVELYNLSQNASFAGGANTLSTQAIILDDDGLGPNLAMFVSDPVLIEGDGGTQQAVFDIRLSRPAESAFSVTYNTVNITAIAGEDYGARAGVLTFEEGQDRAAVIVNVVGDTSAEATESFGLNIQPPGNVSISPLGMSGEATIMDDDSGPGPVLSIARVDNAGEGYNHYIRYVVTLSEPATQPVSFAYQTTLGTASDSDLYGASSSSQNNGTATIDPGETSTSIFIRVGSDSEDERDESVMLTLRNPVGAALAGGVNSLTGVGFIQDDDGVGLNIALAGVPTTVAEPASGSRVIEVPVELSRASASALTFDVAVNGGSATPNADFRLIDDQITFDPGQVTTGVRLRVNGDYVNEGLETILLNYSPVPGSQFAGGILDHTVTIANYAVATEGDDVINGTEAAENIDALAGNDRVLGNGGNDTLRGGNGVDTLNGGDGDDFIFGGGDENDLRDTIIGGNGNDSADGGYGNDLIYGGSGNDTLEGGFGVDEIIGQDGDDVLSGSAWSDAIFGGNGNDFINGGFGFDRVNGGAHADRFFHLGVLGHGSDWIQDYTAAEGDVLLSGIGGSSLSDYLLSYGDTPNAGVAGISEAFIRYAPTGQILWALVDGGGQADINIQIGGNIFDLTA